MWSGWSAVGWLGKWVVFCLLSTLRVPVLSFNFIALGNQACVGQLGSAQTAVALSSRIFLSTAAITLNGGKP